MDKQAVYNLCFNFIPWCGEKRNVLVNPENQSILERGSIQMQYDPKQEKRFRASYMIIASVWNFNLLW